MTPAAPRELTEEEFIYLYVEDIPINASYAAKAIPTSKLIELLDTRNQFEAERAKVAKLVEALKEYADPKNFDDRGLGTIDERLARETLASIVEGE